MSLWRMPVGFKSPSHFVTAPLVRGPRGFARRNDVEVKADAPKNMQPPHCRYKVTAVGRLIRIHVKT